MQHTSILQSPYKLLIFWPKLVSHSQQAKYPQNFLINLPDLPSLLAHASRANDNVTFLPGTRTR